MFYFECFKYDTKLLYFFIIEKVTFFHVNILTFVTFVQLSVLTRAT